jgi:hypothetical protein
MSKSPNTTVPAMCNSTDEISQRLKNRVCKQFGPSGLSGVRLVKLPENGLGEFPRRVIAACD